MEYIKCGGPVDGVAAVDKVDLKKITMFRYKVYVGRISVLWAYVCKPVQLERETQEIKGHCGGRS
uniref:Uncharacterized protein n=1 Tax=Parascaris equorum TaxID=6256 RepID=A0A914S756_PAREQ